MTLEEMVRECIRRIKETPRGLVYASRKGIVAGVTHMVPSYHVLLRRVNGVGIRLELWPHSDRSGKTIHRFALPVALQREAAAVLDAL